LIPIEAVHVVEDPYNILSDGELEADGIPEKKPLLTKVVM